MRSAVFHGSVSEEEIAHVTALGLELFDLSANLNPYGPLPSVLRAARAARISRYPDAAARPLREAYAASASIAAESVLAGNGSSELIYLAIRAFAGAERPVCILGPTFGEYAAAARAADAPVTRVTATAPSFDAPCDALVETIARARPALTVVCNPNNPTGVLLAPGVVDRLTAAMIAVQGRLLLDEAYVDFAPVGSAAAPAPGRLILRTLTKLHAMPGLRVGFLLAAPDDIAAVERLQPPWPISAPAMAASLQALREVEFAGRSRQQCAELRERMRASLADADFAGPPSSANFVMCNVGEAAGFRARLMVRGFAVRDCTSFGLADHVRVALPPERQLDRLIATMKEVR